jgi:hypothetical protein
MSHLGYADAFGQLGATLHNVQWSVCAENGDGDLVLSCWDHRFGKSMDGKIRYTDDLDRWRGPGNAELRACLARAFEVGQTVRAVIAKADEPVSVETGADASKIKKTFSVKEDWYGNVTEFDGTHVVIEFKLGYAR